MAGPMEAAQATILTSQTLGEALAAALACGLKQREATLVALAPSEPAALVSAAARQGMALASAYDQAALAPKQC